MYGHLDCSLVRGDNLTLQFQTVSAGEASVLLRVDRKAAQIARLGEKLETD